MPTDAASIAVLASIVTAAIMIIPGVIASYVQRRREAEQSSLEKLKEDNQGKKDEAQAQMEMNKAVTASAMAMLQPLRDELTRIQARNTELEASQISLITEKGRLMQDNINKDAELLQMKYKFEKLEMRLNATLPPNEQTTHGKLNKNASPKKEDTIPRALVVEMKALEEKKVLVEEDTNRQLEEVKSKSITNGTSGAPLLPPELGE